MSATRIVDAPTGTFAFTQLQGSALHDQLQGSTLQYDPPSSQADQPKWLAGLKADRETTLNNIGFKGGVFDTPQLEWTQTSWIQPQMHPCAQRDSSHPAGRRLTVRISLQV